MGEDISRAAFGRKDIKEFQRRLRRETELLGHWLADGAMDQGPGCLGVELEMWLVDRYGRPAAHNELLLEAVDHDWLVAELAAFNVELNSPHHRLDGRPFSALFRDLETMFGTAREAAGKHEMDLLLAGILPSLDVAMLHPRYMSRRQRYLSLNQRILEMRGGQPTRIRVDGLDQLRLDQPHVMMEAATTSLQVHLQVSPQRAGHLFNLCKVLSAPMLALSANSPYLFGRDLWAETRIPVFEQSVEVGATDLTKRVSFGYRYVAESVFECFQANLRRYPVLLPEVIDAPLEQLSHLRLHNGTIWRWNRPLVGFDEGTGRPHIRLEHRVMPAGPSLADNVANTAFFVGLLHGLEQRYPEHGMLIPFAQARRNFYLAARYGFGASLCWFDGQVIDLLTLLRSSLLPLAETGLAAVGVAGDEIDRWLGPVTRRLELARNGSLWQRGFVARHGASMADLLAAYRARQSSGKPLHDWEE